MDDVTAWSMLAFVVAIARATSVGRAVFKLGLVLVFITLMLFVIKPKLPKLAWAASFGAS
jgi:Kef-type K+ transport system membrane component KefB